MDNQHPGDKLRSAVTGRRQAALLLSLLIWMVLLLGCGPQPANLVTATAEPVDTPATSVPATTSRPLTQTPAATASATPAPATSTPPATTTNTPPASTAESSQGEPGILIGITLQSQAGLLLDDFPEDMRDRIAGEALEQGEDAWLARAERQVTLLKLRLNFRNFFQAGKGQLPLSPRALWQIELDPAGPARQSVNGHDLVVWPYTFRSTLLTDQESPGVVEPALAAEGGVWEEPFILPVDPDMLLQRTGNACLNEAGFPPNSYDSENTYHFYDFACTPDSVGALGCHRTVRPQLSCIEALEARVGLVDTAVRFEHLPWDEKLADQVRIGPITSAEAPDLQVVGDDLEINRIVYRYIEANDCAIEEGAVGGAGWRRLLQFDATLHNVGGTALHVGPVTAEDNEHHVFEYNGCHDHFHYSNYGSFQLRNRDDVSASKQAFCVQSTSRYSNNELSPLRHDYTCSFQGIQAGWVDEYAAGLDVQWIDVTDIDIPDEGLDVALGFLSNQDRFLCEGTPILDENGSPLWEATDQLTADGEQIQRPQCNFLEDWDTNNFEERSVFIPQVGSFVTKPCGKGEVGPYRNCGFAALPEEEAPVCTPGEPIDLTIPLAANESPQILRVCERSEVLGSGIACTYAEALANVVLDQNNSRVTFSCPAVRDSEDGGGGYALYSAPLWPADAAEELTAVP